MWGAFAYVGADLHLRFGVPSRWSACIVGAFGIGGLIYSLSVRRAGRRASARSGLATARRRDARHSPI